MRRTITILVALGPAACLVDRGDVDDEPLVPARVQTAFDRNCALSGCHNATTAINGLSLAAGDSDAIVGGAAKDSPLPLVELGNIEGSYLAQKLLGGPDIVGDQMPPPDGDGDFQDITAILAWIGGYSFEGVPECFADEGCACADGQCYAGLSCEEGTCVQADFPDPPTFDAHVWPILDANCSCHKNAGSGAGMTLTLTQDEAYANMVDVDYGMRKFVAPGDLKSSHVWQVVTGADGIPMPLGGPPLDGFELQIIREWIEADAPE